MITQTTMKARSVIHIWPYSETGKLFSNEREADVWEELRDITFDEDVRGNIYVFTHCESEILKAMSGPNGGKELPAPDVEEEKFANRLTEDKVVRNRVKIIQRTEVEQEIFYPAKPAHTCNAFTKWDDDGPEIPDTIEVPAKPARKEIVKRLVPLHLGCYEDAAWLVGEYRKREVSAVVLWYPDESRHLRYLHKVVTECPELPIYLFHFAQHPDKWGVEREKKVNTAGSLWDTQSELLDESELQAVIEHIANVGESTWIFGPPKQGKTWIMLCIVKALLKGEPLFSVSNLKVPHPSKRVIYLCPEAGRTGLKKRLKMLGLTDHLYDPITNADGGLYLRSLSKGPKLDLADASLLELAKGADVFIDTAIRYVDGDENNATDVKDMTEKILNLLAMGARSMWVAHHSGKSFASATDITFENCARGSTEFTAALTNGIGIVQLDKDKNLIHFHYIDGRDMNEPAADMHLQGRPYLSQIGNFQATENVERFKGRNTKSGPKTDPDRQLKIDLAKNTDGSLQDKADAVNKEFGSNHSKSTVSEWLKEKTFDSGEGAA